jgi:hypothetical protein
MVSGACQATEELEVPLEVNARRHRRERTLLQHAYAIGDLIDAASNGSINPSTVKPSLLRDTACLQMIGYLEGKP